ncbi:MAG: aa3-type cytochrome c oxidase subunit IV [Sneathiellales bacterium]|nr:aa3-type cytochrome c oxidase subunit IV [Sneathiellales bacterium]
MHEPGSMNIEQQKGAYNAFVKLTTVSTIGLTILLILMAIFLL